MNTENDDKLMAMAAELDQEIPPERDLWPEIEAAIQPQQKRRWTPYLAQAAAVFLLVGASSGITYMMMKEDVNVSPQIVPYTSLDSEFTSFGHNFELGQGFQAARASLSAQLDVRLDRLSPEARQGVEENLAVIRNAITEINSELDEDPDNVLLQELLLRTYHEELNVMRNVGGLTQDVMSRNDI